MAAPKCRICHLGMEVGPLYRVNEKGVRAIWAHAVCDQPAEFDSADFAEELDAMLNDRGSTDAADD